MNCYICSKDKDLIGIEYTKLKYIGDERIILINPQQALKHICKHCIKELIKLHD